MTQEIFFLCNSRSARFINFFVDSQISDRILSMDPPFTVPEFADEPRAEFDTEHKLLDYLESNDCEPYALYWRERQCLRQAMAFFTVDGAVILGLADFFDDPLTTLRELALRFGATHFRLGWEQRPPESASEFIKECAHKCSVQVVSKQPSPPNS